MSNNLGPAPFEEDQPIRMYVYRSVLSDATNNGVSSRQASLIGFTKRELADEYIEKLPASVKDRAELVCILDEFSYMDGGKTIRAFPYLPYKEGKWQMFGGNIALISPNVNFGNSAKFSNIAIKIMDRIEF